MTGLEDGNSDNGSYLETNIVFGWGAKSATANDGDKGIGGNGGAGGIGAQTAQQVRMEAMVPQEVPDITLITV